MNCLSVLITVNLYSVYAAIISSDLLENPVEVTIPARIGEVSLFADTNASLIMSITELYKSAFTFSIALISGTTPFSPNRRRMFPAFSAPPNDLLRFS